MEKREGVLWVLLLVSLVIGIYTITNLPEAQPQEVKALRKAGYVDVAVVFNKFEMKLELEKKLENDLLSKQAVVDSLMFQLQSFNNELQSKQKPSDEEILEFQKLQNYYMQQKQTFDNYSDELTAKYDAQILEQMSQYIRDYGEQNGFDYIFGANGNGNIMYGDPLNNVTEDIILYINKSYQGKN